MRPACGAECLGQVRGDRGRLRQHPQRLRAPDLVPAAGGRIVLARGEAQRGIHYGIHARQLAETLGHERAGTVVQERRIGMPSQPRDHRVAFVAARSDGVEHLVLDAQHARHQVEVARDQLRFEQILEVARGAKAARQDRFVGARGTTRLAEPVLREFDEVLVADFGAVDVLVAGGNRLEDGGHGGPAWTGLRARDPEGVRRTRRARIAAGRGQRNRLGKPCNHVKTHPHLNPPLEGEDFRAIATAPSPSRGGLGWGWCSPRPNAARSFIGWAFLPLKTRRWRRCARATPAARQSAAASELARAMP
jgi:hypothetical protein